LGHKKIHRQQNPTKMKFAILTATTIGAACAFTPSTKVTTTTTTSSSKTARYMSDVTEPVEEEVVKVTPINGWVPDASKPCYGLPGATAPFGFFDPLGFSNDKEVMGVKRLREAEVLHGRVAMMATVGYLIGESTPTIAYGMDTHHTIANNQIPEVPGTVLFPFFLLINITEAWRANRGWVEP